MPLDGPERFADDEKGPIEMANQQRFTSMMSRRSFIRGAVATGAMLALAGSGSLILIYAAGIVIHLFAPQVLLAVGSMVTEAVEVRELLARHHVDAAVVNCSTVKPMDEQMLRCLAGRPWITMEEHVLTGGFGAQVCSWCVGEECPPPALTFGIADTFVQHGDRDLLLKYLGLQPKQMARRIRAALEEKKNG